MVSQDNEKFIGLLKVYLVLGGLWEYASTGSIKIKIYKAYSILAKISFALFCILVYVEYARIIIKHENEVIMSQLFLMINMIKLPIRMWILLRNKTIHFLKIIMEKEELVWTQDDEIKEFYREKTKECRNLIALLIIFNVAGGLMLQVVSLYGTIRLIEFRKTHNETVEPHYAFQLWLPIDKVNHTYVFSTIHVWLISMGHVGYAITVMISPLLFIFVNVQLGILEIKLRKLFPSEADNFDMKMKVMELKNLVKEHQYIIKFCHDLNNAVKNLMLLEFLTSLIDIGASLVNIMKIDSLRWMLLVSAVIMLLLTQIFLLSWTSNEVKIQSEQIANAAFESKWYLLNKEGKYLIYFIIARAQKPLTITIGRFCPMTTATIITILRAAYSYISVIKGQ